MAVRGVTAHHQRVLEFACPTATPFRRGLDRSRCRRREQKIVFKRRTSRCAPYELAALSGRSRVTAQWQQLSCGLLLAHAEPRKQRTRRPSHNRKSGAPVVFGAKRMITSIDRLHSSTIRPEGLGEPGPCASLVLGDAEVGFESGHIRTGT
jgi:hypothetical protein